MSRFSIPALALSACLGLATGSAQATTWQLLDASFDDNTLIEGSFDYAEGTGVYSNWNITVLAGTVMTAYTYQPGLDGGFAGSPSSTQVDLVAFEPATSGRYIRLAFTAPLVDTGVLIPLQTAGQSFECDNCTRSRLITSGLAQAVPVPEPASWALLGLGVLALGGLQVRRRSAPEFLTRLRLQPA